MRQLALVFGVTLLSISAAAVDPGTVETTFSGTAYDFALNPHNSELYASIDTGVLVIDTVTLEQEGVVPISGAPRGVAVSPDGTRLYVATSATQGLVVVDLGTLAVIDTIALPAVPFDVEAGNGGRIYVTPGYTSSYRGIMQVDATTGTYVKDFSDNVFVYYSGLLQISPDRNSLYFANRGLSPGTLAKFDVSGPDPVKVYQNDHGALGSNGQDLGLTPDGKYVYYAVGGGNRVTGGYDIARIRTFDMTIQGALVTGAYPREITTSPDGKVAYAIHSSGHIDVWNTETQTRITDYVTSGEATELIVDHSGDHLFASFPGGLRVYRAEGSEPLVDADQDGVEDSVDNCPGIANPTQEDADRDRAGDPCDPFPNEPNHELAQCRIDLTDRNASLQACSADLTDRNASLQACSADLGTCVSDLVACTESVPRDSDGDGEVDARDACPATPAGTPIDSAGCTQSQFCARHAQTAWSCLVADWDNDEPGTLTPADCRFERSYSPRTLHCLAN